MPISAKERYERCKKLEEITKPLIDFLYEYGCPYTTLIITQTSVELVNSECTIPIEPRD